MHTPTCSKEVPAVRLKYCTKASLGSVSSRCVRDEIATSLCEEGRDKIHRRTLGWSTFRDVGISHEDSKRPTLPARQFAHWKQGSAGRVHGQPDVLDLLFEEKGTKTPTQV